MQLLSQVPYGADADRSKPNISSFQSKRGVGQSRDDWERATGMDTGSCLGTNRCSQKEHSHDPAEPLLPAPPAYAAADFTKGREPVQIVLDALKRMRLDTPRHHAAARVQPKTLH